MQTALWIWGFPKVGSCLGGPITRTLSFWGLYWGPLMSGTLPLGVQGPNIAGLQGPNTIYVIVFGPKTLLFGSLDP